MNDNTIDTNKLFGIATVLVLEKMNSKSEKATIKSSTAEKNAGAPSTTRYY